jgi:hypothetical protein
MDHIIISVRVSGETTANSDAELCADSLGEGRVLQRVTFT